MTKVKIDDIKAKNSTSLYLLTAEETYFYCVYDGKITTKTIYFYFEANSKSISTLQACCTNTTPIDWSSCQDC